MAGQAEQMSLPAAIVMSSARNMSLVSKRIKSGGNERKRLMMDSLDRNGRVTKTTAHEVNRLRDWPPLR
ncbi:hypothetical protein KIN20_011311 [Parelaphostrongylus tenuis]|uniref:Uncharacterized protein n=1 Tax=Parelaphostrongylus tenuis TaxID=148309 RepID=A0AAD5QKY4_PARTN|nr:hypothetical protein KIN20_011311 [Parelaphostrongylus tenuis]